jgi:molybdate transport system regulatory protein
LGIKLTYKIWLDSDNGIAFGEGVYRLLKGVELTGCLREATAATGMAYSKARRIIENCEGSLGFALIVRKKGGASGGSSAVTPEGIGVMRSYEALRAEVEDAVGEAYKKHFGHAIQVQIYEMVTRKRGVRKAAE